MSLQYSKKLPSFTESLLPYLQTKDFNSSNKPFITPSSNNNVFEIISTNADVVQTSSSDSKQPIVSSIKESVTDADFFQILAEGINFVEESMSLPHEHNSTDLTEQHNMLDENDYARQDSIFSTDLAATFNSIDNQQPHLYVAGQGSDDNNSNTGFQDIMRFCQEDYGEHNSSIAQRGNEFMNDSLTVELVNDWNSNYDEEKTDPIKEYDHILARRIAEELGVCDSKHTFNSTNFPDGTGKKNAWGRLSYADLIGRAIESSPKKRLTLAQIYEWMVRYVPYFKDKGDKKSSVGWKNSVRHNLSLHEQFVRIRESDTSKTSWWTLNLNAARSSNSGSNQTNSVNGQLISNHNSMLKTSNCRKRRKKTLSSMLGKMQAIEDQAIKSTTKNKKSNDTKRYCQQQQQHEMTLSMLDFNSNNQQFSQNNLTPTICRQNLQDEPLRVCQQSLQQPLSIERNSPSGSCLASNSSLFQNNELIHCNGSTYRTFATDRGDVINLNNSSVQPTNQHENSEHIENASLLLSAACSLMTRQQHQLDDQQIYTSNLNSSRRFNDPKNDDESLFLLQLANGQLCRVLPNNGIDYSIEDINMSESADNTYIQKAFGNHYQNISSSPSQPLGNLLKLSMQPDLLISQPHDQFEMVASGAATLKDQVNDLNHALVLQPDHHSMLSTTHDIDFNDIHTFR
ncbi:hypothetical protein GJ496_000649 [Pomphorhynchus laevis]|nr:hypothetical protein GJ496_000649 [Pomphorhynchus laevis]